MADHDDPSVLPDASTELAPARGENASESVSDSRDAEWKKRISAPEVSPPWDHGHRVAERFVIVERLGRGGEGLVYRAADTKTGRHVAIKRFVPDAARSVQRQHFTLEAVAMARVNHPHVVGLIDAATDEHGDPYLVLELLEGETLASWGRQERSHEEIVHVLGQVLDGLQALHDHGVVHRDLKPQNVFVTRGGVVKILDLGLASIVVDTALEAALGIARGVLEQPPAASGTPGYMAPEQWDATPADVRADVWGVGVLLYELSMRKRAFPAGARPEHTPKAESDDALDVVVVRALQIGRDARYPSALAMRDALEAALDREPSIRLRALARSIAAHGVKAGIPRLGARPSLTYLAGVLRGCFPAQLRSGDQDALTVRLAQALLLRVDRKRGQLDALLYEAREHRGPRAWLRPTSATLADTPAALRARTRGHDAPPFHVGSARFVAASADRNGAVLVWKQSSGEELASFRNPGAAPIASLTFLDDGESLVVGAHDGVVRVLDAKTAPSDAARAHAVTRQYVLRWAGEMRPPRSIPERDPRLLAASAITLPEDVTKRGPSTHLVTIYGTRLASLSAHGKDRGKIVVTVSPIAAGCAPGELRPSMTMRFDDVTSRASLIAGTSLGVAVCGRTMVVFDWHAGVEHGRHVFDASEIYLDGGCSSVAAVRGGTDIIVGLIQDDGSCSRLTIVRWPFERAAGPHIVHDGDEIWPSPTCLALRGGDEPRVVVGYNDGSLLCYATDGTASRPLSRVQRAHEDVVGSVAFTPDGRSVVSASLDGTCASWWLDRFDEGETRQAPRAPQPRPARDAYLGRSATGWEVRAVARNAIELRAPSGEIVGTKEHEDVLKWTRATPSDDGSRVAAWNGDELVVWDPTSWTEICGTRAWSGYFMQPSDGGLDGPAHEGWARTTAVEHMAFRGNDSLVVIGRDTEDRPPATWTEAPYERPRWGLYVWGLDPDAPAAPRRIANVEDDRGAVIRLSPNGDRVVGVTGNAIWMVTLSGSEPETRARTWSAPRSGGVASHVALSQDGESIAVAMGNVLEQWRPESDQHASVAIDAPIRRIGFELDGSVLVEDAGDRVHRFDWVDPASGARSAHARSTPAISAWDELRAKLMAPPQPRLGDVARVEQAIDATSANSDLAWHLERAKLLAPTLTFATRCLECDWPGVVEYSDPHESGYTDCPGCVGTGLARTSDPSAGLMRRLASNPDGVQRAEACVSELLRRTTPWQVGRPALLQTVWLHEPDATSINTGRQPRPILEWLRDAVRSAVRDATLPYDDSTQWSRWASTDLGCHLAWLRAGTLTSSLTHGRPALRGLSFGDLESPFEPLVDIWSEGYGVVVCEPYVVLIAPS